MRIALPIVPVKVKVPEKSQFVHTCALLDSGFTSTFCSEELMQSIGAQGENAVLKLTTLEKEHSVSETVVISLQISDLEDKNVIDLPVVYTRPSLPVNMENMLRAEDIRKWSHLQDVHFPEIDHMNAKVSIIIGQDNPEVLMPIDVKRGQNPNEPYATKTVLGWTLNGPLGGKGRHVAMATFIQADHELNEQLEQFWKIEGHGTLISDKKGLSIEDKRVLALWEDKIQHDEHYSLPIPFKDRQPHFPPNKQMAEQRLDSLK
ncbi:uncharacterized protein LOC106162566 [Lingula anatina]|uniref:Uncharacterized protein LOC106162566 n=1 Tax=Lingula anatina TaxID=7574 RepID=A0A1S3IAP2_LINAN|nr:uncharacterized protein LOC106162566 [Lingula anatina]|eukprot:XP_013395335.1 uncharacterized protein LOC106162566 [Lingula anatina]